MRGPSDLVRPLCHEIGNLMAGIRLTAHVLGGERDVPDRMALARDQQRMVAHAGALLALVRPLVSPDSVERRPVGTADLLAAVSRGLGDVVPVDQRLSVPKGRGLPDVRADADIAHHGLVALLLASVEAAGAEGHVRLRAVREDRKLLLTLTDPGAPAEPAARGETPHGRALQIAAVDAAMRAAGGRVRAVDAPRGSRIEIVLPVARS